MNRDNVENLALDLSRVKGERSRVLLEALGTLQALRAARRCGTVGERQKWLREASGRLNGLEPSCLDLLTWICSASGIIAGMYTSLQAEEKVSPLALNS